MTTIKPSPTRGFALQMHLSDADAELLVDALTDATDYRRGEWSEADRAEEVDAEDDCALADHYADLLHRIREVMS